MTSVALANSFEEDRQARIEANKRRLLQLGIAEATKQLKAGLTTDSHDGTSRQLKHTKSSVGAVPPAEPARTSARLQVKQIVHPSMRSSPSTNPSYVLPDRPPKTGKGPNGARDYTSHNLMRLLEMDIPAQERRIQHITNVAKLQNLVRVYAHAGDAHMWSTAYFRLARLQLQAQIEGT